MPLEKQVVDLPFGSGIREREADHLVQAPGALELENFDFEQSGGYRPRDGFSALGLTGLPHTPPPNSLFSYQGALYCNTFKDGLYVRNPTANRWRKSNNAAPHPLSLKTQEMLRHHLGVAEVDACVHNGYVFLAWNNAASSADSLKDIYWMTLDANDYSVVTPPARLENCGYGVRLCPFTKGNPYVAVIGVLPNGGGAGVHQVKAALITANGSPPSAGAVTTLAADATQLGGGARDTRLDAHSISTKEFFTVAYWNGTDTKVHKVDNTLTILSTATVATSSVGGIGVYHSDTQSTIYVGISDNTNVKCFTVSEAYAAGAVNTIFADTKRVAIAVTGRITLTDDGSGNLWLAWSSGTTESDTATLLGAGPPQVHEVVFSTINSSTGAQTGTVGRLYGALLFGKAFRPANHAPHVPIINSAWLGTSVATGTGRVGSTTSSSCLIAAAYTPSVTLANEQGQSTTIVNNNPRLKIVGTFFNDRLLHQDTLGHLPNVTQLSSSVWLFMGQAICRSLIRAVGGLPSSPRGDARGADLVTIDFTAVPVKYADANEGILGSGGLPIFFDGLMASEAQPLSAPGYPFRTNTAGTGLLAGTKFKAFWTWRDQKGRLHRSSPGLDIDEVSGELEKQVYIFQYPPTNLDGENGYNLLLAIYKKAPSEAGYTIRALLDPINNAAGTAGYLSFDTLTTTSATGGDTLYTDAGELESLPLPPFLDVEDAGGFVFGIDGESPDRIWCGKRAADEKAFEFNSDMTVKVPEANELVALGSIDDKLVGFAKNGIYYLNGEGFTDKGLGGYILQRISSDVGCARRNSVVSGVFGLLFEADRGVYLLDRGLSVQYIGEAVQDDFKEAVCQRAVVLDKRNQVWFIFTDRVLVWDYIHNAWTKFTPSTTPSGGEGATPHTILDACRHLTDIILTMQNTAVLRIWKYDSAASTDNGARIVPKVKTPWVKLTALQGFARLWRVLVLGYNDTSGGNLTVRAYINYDGSSAAWTKQWRKTDRSAGERLQVKIHNEDQKIESVRLEITGETIDGGAFDLTARYTLSGITLEAGILPGTFKHLPAVDRK